MDTTPSDSTLNHESKEFQPIRFTDAADDGTAAGNTTQSATQKASSLRSISRTRSHNGYGCDDIVEQEQEGIERDAEKDGGVQKDPFEVTWENGENDPANPRSMTKARKWLVVLIVSASSLCV